MEDLRRSKLEEILLSAPNITCDCGGTVFENGVVLKRVSELVSPSGKEEIVPVDVFICKKCGKIISDMFKSEDNCRRTVGANTEISKHSKSTKVETSKSNLII